MIEVVKCPCCNAQIHISQNSNITKCEYCDTELIINNNTQNFSTPVNNNANTGIYAKKMKKWKKLFRKYLIIQAVLTAFFGVLMEADATGIGVIIFIIATFYSFVLPERLLKNKPLSSKPHKNNKFLDFMKIYPAFAVAFWGGMILMAIILSINP